MADRETLLVINAQLVSKLTAGTATDDDIKTLTVVMGLIEKEASKGSISSSVPQTAPSGRCGAGASAAATSVKILQKRKKNGRKSSGSRQPRGTRIISADRALEARKDAAAAERVAAAERAMAAREEDEKKTKATTWASYSGGGSGRSYDSSYSSYSPRAATSMAEAAKVDAIIEKLKSAADSEPRRHVGPFGHPTDRWQPFSHDSFESLRTP